MRRIRVMAIKVSFKDVSPELKYEPGLENRQGINDSTTDTQMGTLSRTYFPPRSKSRTHYHENADLAWHCISGKAIWLIGKEKKEYVLEPGDFLYIPRGEIHSTMNPSETEPVEGVGSYFGCSHPRKSGKVIVE
jgi:quercetin dioxygenase-like cupin family protein